MQLRMTVEELNLLANTLLESASGISGQDRGMFNAMLDKIMARDLRLDSDELEKLSDILGTSRNGLREEIARTPSDVGLRAKLEILERILERVNEACVMF